MARNINIMEDKIFKFSEFEPTKYNSNVIIENIMLWLRNYEDQPSIKIQLDDFLNKTKIDKNKFLTFISGLEKTNKIESFNIRVDNDQVIIDDIKW